MHFNKLAKQYHFPPSEELINHKLLQNLFGATPRPHVLKLLSRLVLGLHPSATAVFRRAQMNHTNFILK